MCIHTCIFLFIWSKSTHAHICKSMLRQVSLFLSSASSRGYVSILSSGRVSHGHRRADHSSRGYGASRVTHTYKLGIPSHFRTPDTCRVLWHNRWAEVLKPETGRPPSTPPNLRPCPGYEGRAGIHQGVFPLPAAAQRPRRLW